MDQVANLASWKKLLEELEVSDNKSKPQVINKLTVLFEHVSPHFAPRHKRDFEHCASKSEELLRNQFEEIDLSDKKLLTSYLELLKAYGYFKITQITYHVESPSDNPDLDTSLLPTIEKVKWYDMSPLLPNAGTLGWKSIMNHGLVKEERQLMKACIKLLALKLQFYSIISLLDRFRDSSSQIKRNGERVAEKLFELIRDVAYDDEGIIGLDIRLFNLLLPFTDETQQAAIIDALVQDIFKPFLSQKPIDEQDLNTLFELINECIMNKSYLQDTLFTKMLEHLKCNVIRRKRRHSVETASKNGHISLESLIESTINGDKMIKVLEKVIETDSNHKSLQLHYINTWVEIFDRILPLRTIRVKNALKLITTSSILIVLVSNLNSEDLVLKLSTLVATAIENTEPSRFEKLFSKCDPSFLITLTQILSDSTQIVSSYNAPVQQLYTSYLRRYLRCCTMRSTKLDKFVQFNEFICDKSNDRDTGHLLQSLCIHELAGCLENFKNRVSNKTLDLYMECARLCSKKLYKFIKRNSKLKSGFGDDSVDEMDVDNDAAYVEYKKVAATDALVCILRVAIGRQDQELLDSYSDLLIKLYSSLISRVEMLIGCSLNGTSVAQHPIDSHILKLFMCYIEHKDLICAYLDYDLIESISKLLQIESVQLEEYSQEAVKSKKKLFYNQIKTKLDNLETQAKRSSHVYQTIINKQYSAVSDHSIGSDGDIRKEKSCCHNYKAQIKLIEDLCSILIKNCTFAVYEKTLSAIVKGLESCDPLDHTRIQYHFIILESIVTASPQTAEVLNLYKSMLPRISCSLIGISKAVELGPSIHAFTRSGVHKTNRGIQCCTYTSCIKIYTAVFLKFPSKFTNQFITEAMQICVSSNLSQYAKYSVRLHKFFNQLSLALADLIHSICIGRREEDILPSSLPIFLLVFSHLIQCLILASNRDNLVNESRARINGHGDTEQSIQEDGYITSASKDQESNLERLARDIGRTFNNLSSLRIKMIDYAPYLISNYIKDIQRASCPDFVRLHLNEGIFRIFNLIDAHQKERQEDIMEAGIQRKTMAGRARGSLFDMIHARLDQSSREIFRDLYNNYNRFHRYLGKI